MQIHVEVPEIRGGTMKFVWEGGFNIASERLPDGSVVIAANAAGLVSLARHLLAIAQDNVPNGYDFHLDDCNGGLEDGSVHLIFERRDGPSTKPEA